MLDNWRTRRRLQRHFDVELDAIGPCAMAFKKRAEEVKPEERQQFLADYEKELRRIRARAYQYKKELSIYTTTWLIRKADQLAIDIPSPQNRPDWWENDYEDGMPDEAVQEWLSEKGQIATRKLIRIERRANFEWWFAKIVIPVLQVLIPILALIVGLVSVSKR